MNSTCSPQVLICDHYGQVITRWPSLHAAEAVKGTPTAGTLNASLLETQMAIINSLKSRKSDNSADAGKPKV